jgi:hypothetical protein
MSPGSLCAARVASGPNGLSSLLLENDRLRVSVLPGLGGRIHEFVDKQTGRDWLYHSPGILPRPASYGANYDDWWTGGVDEILPTGWPCDIDGRSYPLLGELWSQDWVSEVTQNTPEAIEVHLVCTAHIAQVKVERWMRLKAGEARLYLDHRLTNLNPNHLTILWGLHPAFALDHDDYRLDIPSQHAIVDPGSPDYRADTSRYQWPDFPMTNGSLRDMRFPPGIGSQSWHLHTLVLDEGWLALFDLRANQGIRMEFERAIFSAVQLWGVYGGWRPGVYCISPEPWTGWSSDLRVAAQQKTALTLEPSQIIETGSVFELI